MPKYYCDYCDVFLTHDSPSVRKSHNEGWKHKAAVRAYFSQFEEDLTQKMIDQKVKEWEGKVSGGALRTGNIPGPSPFMQVPLGGTVPFGRGFPFPFPGPPTMPMPQGQGNIPTPQMGQ